jgi:hypothetical protein
MASSSCTDVRAVITDSYLHKAAAGATWRGRRRRGPAKLSKRGRARYGTHRTGFILAVLRRRGGLWGGRKAGNVVGDRRRGHPVEGSPA